MSRPDSDQCPDRSRLNWPWEDGRPISDLRPSNLKVEKALRSRLLSSVSLLISIAYMDSLKGVKGGVLPLVVTHWLIVPIVYLLVNGELEPFSHAPTEHSSSSNGLAGLKWHMKVCGTGSATSCGRLERRRFFINCFRYTEVTREGRSRPEVALEDPCPGCRSPEPPCALGVLYSTLAWRYIARCETRDARLSFRSSVSWELLGGSPQPAFPSEKAEEAGAPAGRGGR